MYFLILFLWIRCCFKYRLWPPTLMISWPITGLWDPQLEHHWPREENLNSLVWSRLSLTFYFDLPLLSLHQSYSLVPGNASPAPSHFSLSLGPLEYSSDFFPPRQSVFNVSSVLVFWQLTHPDTPFPLSFLGICWISSHNMCLDFSIQWLTIYTWDHGLFNIGPQMFVQP